MEPARWFPSAQQELLSFSLSVICGKQKTNKQKKKESFLFQEDFRGWKEVEDEDWGRGSN